MRPTLKKEDISNFERVSEFVNWFIKNEPIVNVFSGLSSNIIFNEGIRPIIGNSNDPEVFKDDINDLKEWFVIKIYIDLNNNLKNYNREEFELFIDLLNKNSEETLVIYAEIAMKYNFNMEKFVYMNEIKKIPNEHERAIFKVNFLSDNTLAAETRILAWIYHDYFNEWYQPKKID